uniref:Secreted protein n=1 Tax=Panagrellus redivivus TaxID=6233 RepID=A0A7E4V805_PANRE
MMNSMIDVTLIVTVVKSARMAQNPKSCTILTNLPTCAFPLSSMDVAAMQTGFKQTVNAMISVSDRMADHVLFPKSLLRMKKVNPYPVDKKKMTTSKTFKNAQPITNADEWLFSEFAVIRKQRNCSIKAQIQNVLTATASNLVNRVMTTSARAITRAIKMKSLPTVVRNEG